MWGHFSHQSLLIPSYLSLLSNFKVSEKEVCNMRTIPFLISHKKARRKKCLTAGSISTHPTYQYVAEKTRIITYAAMVNGMPVFKKSFDVI